jgi:hypothetical protein
VLLAPSTCPVGPVKLWRSKYAAAVCPEADIRVAAAQLTDV